MAKRKEPTMKLSNVIWVLGLASSLAFGCAAWTDQQPIQGCDVNPATGICDGGGTGGSAGGGGGGTGGSPPTEGECTTPENKAVYDALTYVDSGGVTETGSDAASAIASDCVFGSFNSDPENPGCPAEAQAVLFCASAGCPPETVAELTVCVVACQDAIIVEVTGESLSEGCSACYGESVACSAANCASSGCSNPNSPMCIECRCLEDCTPGFDRCSGLPSTGDCDPFL